MKPNSQQVRAYHERTKHRLDAYAKGPQYLDWEQQPNPFRCFAGAELVELPLEENPPPTPPFAKEGSKSLPLIGISESGQTSPFEKGGLRGISLLLEFSLGLSAWKQFGPDRWALRCNPSSGNLHPTEGYIVATGIDGLPDGAYHYAPHEHALERRGRIAPCPDAVPQCLFGLSSIVWREAWKYGERAFRYVQLDAGHALGAIHYAAAALGLQVELLAVTDTEIATLLGLDRTEDFDGAETEHPDMLLRIYASQPVQPAYLPTVSEWHGKANPLGGFPHPDWPIIDEAMEASTCIRRGEHRSPSSQPIPAPPAGAVPPDPPTA